MRIGLPVFSCSPFARLFLLLIFVSGASRAQEKDSISYLKLGIVTAGTAGVFYYGYGLVNNMWWKRDRTSFHFDWDKDWTYAEGADKIGHMFFPCLITDTYIDLFRWSGISERSSVWYAAAMGLSYESFIEIRDGFSKKWGFSWGDFAADMIGAGFPVLKYYYPYYKNFRLKISFLPSERFKQGSHAYIIDDYESTYHWLTVTPAVIIPEKIERYIPSFITFAVGHSLKRMDEPAGGEHELFIALDWNLEGYSTGIFELDALLRFLNHYHLPAPAIRLYPSVIWYGLKF